MQFILKTVVVLSAIAGAACGILFLINFLLLKFFIILFLFTLIGGLMIYYLKKNALVGMLSVQDGALIGAITGFVSVAAAAIVYMPISYLLSLIFSTFKQSFTLNFLSISIIFAFIAIFFTALIISAPFNAFSGMAAAFLYEKLENRPFEEYTNFEIEQDD